MTPLSERVVPGRVTWCAQLKSRQSGVALLGGVCCGRWAAAAASVFCLMAALHCVALSQAAQSQNDKEVFHCPDPATSILTLKQAHEVVAARREENLDGLTKIFKDASSNQHESQVTRGDDVVVLSWNAELITPSPADIAAAFSHYGDKAIVLVVVLQESIPKYTEKTGTTYLHDVGMSISESTKALWISHKVHSLPNQVGTKPEYMGSKANTQTVMLFSKKGVRISSVHTCIMPINETLISTEKGLIGVSFTLFRDTTFLGKHFHGGMHIAKKAKKQLEQLKQVFGHIKHCGQNGSHGSLDEFDVMTISGDLNTRFSVQDLLDNTKQPKETVGKLVRPAYRHNFDKFLQHFQHFAKKLENATPVHKWLEPLKHVTSATHTDKVKTADLLRLLGFYLLSDYENNSTDDEVIRWSLVKVVGGATEDSNEVRQELRNNGFKTAAACFRGPITYKFNKLAKDTAASTHHASSNFDNILRHINLTKMVAEATLKKLNKNKPITLESAAALDPLEMGILDWTALRVGQSPQHKVNAFIANQYRVWNFKSDHIASVTGITVTKRSATTTMTLAKRLSK